MSHRAPGFFRSAVAATFRGMGETNTLRRPGAAALSWALLWAYAAGGALSCGPGPSAASRAVLDDAPRPDVIIVAVDGLSWEQFSLFGDALAETPAFDRLVEDGVAYTSAYATSPWAGESLTSVLSGDLPAAVPAGVAAATQASASAPTDPPAPGLAEYLRHLGYRTAFAPSHPLHRPAVWAAAGAAASAGGEDPAGSTGPPPGFDELLSVVGQDELVGAAAHDVAAAAVKWLGAAAGPSLLVCTLSDPRPPHHLFPGHVPSADVPYDGPVRSGLSHAELLRRCPEFGPDDRARLAELHASEVAVAERAFDLIAGAAMNRRPTPPILVLVGLRRPALGESGRYGLLPSFRPADLVVPLVIRFPRDLDGSPGPSGRTSAPVSLYDVAPTLLDALGFEPRLDLEGRSVFPGAQAPSRPLAARTARALGGATLIEGPRAVSIEGRADGSPITRYRRDPELGWEEAPAGSAEASAWADLKARLQGLLPVR